MDKAYRAVFNNATGVWMAVSETARRRGKGRAVALATVSIVVAGATGTFAAGAAAQIVVQDPITGTIQIGAGLPADPTDPNKAEGAVSFATVGGGNRVLTNVAAGRQGTDAINYGQFSGSISRLSSALGGGLLINPATGLVVTPLTYTLYPDASGTTQYHDVEGALGNLNSRIKSNGDSISHLTTQITNGTIGLVQQADASSGITVGKDTGGKEVSFAGKAADGTSTNRKLTHVANGTENNDAVNLGQLKQAGLANADGTLANVVIYDDASKSKVSLQGGAAGTTLTNVAAGNVAATSTDAINGSQLYATNQAIASMLGTTLNAGGTIHPISFSAGGTTYGNVREAFAGLGDRVFSLEQISSSGGGSGGSSGSGGGDNGAGGNGGQANPMFASRGATTSSKETAVASGANATAAGANAVASADNSVALGAASVADRAGTVSVGSVGNERIVANVKAGVQDTDAVNVKQLNETTSGIQQSVNNLQGQVNQMDSKINRVGAMNAAMSTMVASAAGLQTDNRMAIGTGLYRGQTALAIGYQRKVAARATVTIGGSTAGGSEYNVGVGAGYGW